MRRRDFMHTAAFIAGSGFAFGSRSVSAAEAADPASALMRSTLVVDGVSPSPLTADYLDMLKAGGVDCWHVSMDGLQSFADAWRFLDAHQDRIVPAMSVREIRAAKAAGKLSLILGAQSAEWLGDTTRNSSTNASPLLDSRTSHSSLRAYVQLGLRILGIAYNVANYFGGGALDPKIGLSRAGRRLVEEIHALRVVLDVGGHTGEQTSLDAIEISRGVPVICSHTNCAALNDNARAISDRVIDAIAGTGGVIGLTAISAFMTHARDAGNVQVRQASLDEYLDQLDYVRKRVGPDHVGLGPDFVHGHERYTEADRNMLLFPPDQGGLWPWHYAKGFESIAELPNVTQGLLRRGWPAADIRKVLGENWLRVWEQVWGA